MPKSSGGAQNIRRGDRVRLNLSGSYLHFLQGLEGEVTQVLHHGVIVALDNDPAVQQRIITTNTGRGQDQTQSGSGPQQVTRAQRQFQFNEVVRIET
jgi:hypothetical protein